MTGVIMAGGFGTRLKPLTSNIPKPMVPMANRPMMEHVINLLKSHHINQTITLLYHQSHKITSYFSDGSKFDIGMAYIRSDEDYGTAGSVKKAMPLLKDRFIVISGDVLTDINLSDAIQFHHTHKALATVVLTRSKNPLPFGVVITSDSGKITRFLEKPTWGQVFSDTINTGIYILEPEIFEFIPNKQFFDFSKDLFPQLLKDKKALYGYIAEGYWKDVGDLNEYQKANVDCLHEKVKISFPGKKYRENVWLGDNCKIDDEVIFEGPVIIGDNCRIKGNTKLSNSIIGDHSVIDEGCTIYNSILWDNVTIGKSVCLNTDTVASGSVIMDNAFILEDVFISENCSIGSQARIRANVKIWPDKIVDDGAVLSSSLVWGDRWFRELFTYNRITGIINSEVSPEFIAKLGAAYGAYLGQGSSVLCGQDASEAAEMVNNALKSGFMSAGLMIRDLKVIPLPIARYGLRSGMERGGIFIRKSPFDQKLIDILFFDDDGRDLPTGKAKAIERLFFREDFLRASYDHIGKIDYPERVAESYFEDLISHIDARAIEKAKYKVVIDYSFGSAAVSVPSLLGSLACEVISLNAFLDSKKLSKDKTGFDHQLAQLSSIVKSLKADIGFLIDACAEKIFIVDEMGRFIDSDRLLTIIIKLLIDTNCPKKIAVPINASSLIDQIAQKKGIEIIRTRNEPRSIVDAYFTNGVQYAGDTKGGFIFTDFMFAFDGIYSMVKILELMSRNNIHLGQLNESVPNYHLEKVNIPCSWENKGKVMRRLMEYTENKKRQLIDGVKILNSHDWVLILPDNERPFFHVNAEARDVEKAAQLVEFYKAKIEEWIND